MSKQYDVAIIGGGAAGMFAGVFCAKQGKKVLIIEHKKQLGKKILATGNGKCNYTNKKMGPEYYRGEDPDFVRVGLERFGVDETISYLKKMGIYPKEKNGYVYPLSEQAGAVRDVLEMELRQYGAECVCAHAQAIKKTNQFVINTDGAQYFTRRVLLATGGKAYPKLGSDGSGYALAKGFGHRIVEPVPALVGLQCQEAFYKDVAGVRVPGEIALSIDEAEPSRIREAGELQLTAYGLSGIPAFQVSRYAARAIAEGKRVQARVDFMPACEKKELEQLLKKRFEIPGRTAGEALIGFLNDKLISVFLPLSGIAIHKAAKKVNDIQIRQLANLLKEKKTEVIGTNGFEHAQVTAGGVSTEHIDAQTMGSKLVKDLFFAGEVVDVDAMCGGYNLQWCWTSAYLAACAICK